MQKIAKFYTQRNYSSENPLSTVILPRLATYQNMVQNLQFTNLLQMEKGI